MPLKFDSAWVQPCAYCVTLIKPAEAKVIISSGSPEPLLLVYHPTCARLAAHERAEHTLAGLRELNYREQI